MIVIETCPLAGIKLQTKMKSLLTWLQQKLSPDDGAGDPYRHRTQAPIKTSAARKTPSTTAKMTKTPPAPESLDYTSDGPGHIGDGGPGKNILIRNRYIREETGTHETLKIIDDTILDADEPAEFDPYNTGRFDRSKSWDGPARKK